jgi:hypothetical protein
VEYAKPIRADFSRISRTVKTDNQGTAAFRGFFGEYEIIVKSSDGKDLYFRIYPSKNEENKWIFTID